MSFLTRTVTTAVRSTRTIPRAAFSTSLRSQKSVTETAADAAKKVNEAVSGAAIKGIDAAGMCQLFLPLVAFIVSLIDLMDDSYMVSEKCVVLADNYPIRESCRKNQSRHRRSTRHYLRDDR